MKIFVLLLFCPMFFISQEIELSNNSYLVPRLGYSHHFKTNKNAGFAGVDIISKPNFVGANVFAGTNFMQYNNKLKFLPEVGIGVYIFNLSGGVSFSTESFQPSLGFTIYNFARLETGYSFRFKLDTPFQGFYLRFYVNNFFMKLRKMITMKDVRYKYVNPVIN